MLSPSESVQNIYLISAVIGQLMNFIWIDFLNNIKHESYHEDACSVTGTDVTRCHNKRNGCFPQGKESDHFHKVLMQNNDGLNTCSKQWLQDYQSVTRVLTIYMEKLEISEGNSNGSPHSVWEASTLFRGCLHEKTHTGTSLIPR